MGVVPVGVWSAAEEGDNLSIDYTLTWIRTTS